MTHAKITSKFRIQLENEQRTFTPGMVAKGAAADWAIANGYGEKIAAPRDPAAAAKPAAKKRKPAPKNKAKTAPQNKSGFMAAAKKMVSGS